jgi:hypothetical protein
MTHWPAEQHPPHDDGSQTHCPLAQRRPLGHAPAPQVPPQPSSAPHALPLQFGVQPHVPPAHASGAAHAPLQHGCPLPPHVPHVLVPHATPGGHAAHTVPPRPHAPSSAPPRHDEPLQQPAHDVGSQLHTPTTQRWPGPHAPELHTPPQSSLAPHALPAQLGVHPQRPPLHASGGAHSFPGQHACPFPPHVPQFAVPHVTPAAHALHAGPPWPHTSFDVPDLHAVPSQQPEHDVGPHVHEPATHRCPASHAASTHTLPQPSLSPHAFPSQLPVHAPTPQTFATPPPPHVWPTPHPPQSTIFPHPVLCCPQRPAHAASQLAPPSLAREERSSKPHTAEHAPAPRSTNTNAKRRLMGWP